VSHWKEAEMVLPCMNHKVNTSWWLRSGWNHR